MLGERGYCRMAREQRILSPMTSAPEPFESLLAARARIGWGMSVATPRPSMHALYEFGGGYPDPASFPYDGMVEATARMMKDDGAAAMTYGEPQGYRGLRELICHKYERFEAFRVEPENIIVANGSGQALALAFGAFLDPGDPVIAEAPTFAGSLNTLRRHGPEILDVPVDDEGIVTDAVRQRLAALRRQGRRCKLIYTIVNFQNPAGPSQSLRRRQELVALAHEYDTLILEDDAYGELRFEGQTLPPLFALDHGGRVIRAGTLSKILGAGVRIGWLCAPRPMIPAFQSFLFGGGVNPFMSRVATWFLREHLESHIKVLIDVYRAKRDAMRAGLAEVLGSTDAGINCPEGGFFLWIKLPGGVDPRRLATLAVEARVQYTPGPVFYANGGGDDFIRLAFSYEPPEKCYEGARLLGRAVLGARRG
jgi:2-aminoadipate transaminase